MENRKIRPTSRFEEEMVRKRERESRRAETWNGAVKYYEKFEKNNAKFEEWTSPRYYETNNDLMATIKTKRDKLDNLEERRKKLRQLLQDDDRTYAIEATMKMTDRFKENKDIETLKMINDEIKEKEERKQRHEAEKGLYNHWRNNNVVLRECQRQKNTRELKLSWLDQQIEKRMAKERETQMTRKQLEERDACIKRMKVQESEFQAMTQQKSKQLQDDLVTQMNEIMLKDNEAEELKQLERKQMEQQIKLNEIQKQSELEQKRRKDQEVALFNLKQHSRKLELKSKEMERQLIEDEETIRRIKDEEFLERIEDAQKKQVLKESLNSILQLLRELRNLELSRRPHMGFVFESEARDLYNQFEQSWTQEKNMREGLMKDVFLEVKSQIEENARNNLKKQKDLLQERQAMLDDIEKRNSELQLLEDEKERKREEIKSDLDAQIRYKQKFRSKLNNLEKLRNNEELEKIQLEEERLKKEISKISMGNTGKFYGRQRFKEFT
ncbi:PREDICTED: trichoplein keratin filament-binding protein-like [Nicrophorus vespilloides]|uniref:Trichoplein keratin filament-binding protein-like n=1 Tax=Nicrophorus vespilloides TaxID=110193 RepID=A0ABM1NE83_NICVS|nr:PREDICTED: trichoplein keratin filament-binding protein-like [Nicrophorus vespilloides]